MMKRSVGNLMRDSASYVTIAIVVVGIIVALGAYTAKGESPSPVVLNWIGLGGVMTIVYVCSNSKNRALWTNARFWSCSNPCNTG